jgi:hypothetical protein
MPQRAESVPIRDLPAPKNDMMIILGVAGGVHTIQMVSGTWIGPAHVLKLKRKALQDGLGQISQILGDLSEGVAPGSLKTRCRELTGIGKTLWEKLPDSFTAEFAQHGIPGATLMIAEDKDSPSMPWELVSDGDDGQFLADKHRLSRWLQGY